MFDIKIDRFRNKEISHLINGRIAYSKLQNSEMHTRIYPLYKIKCNKDLMSIRSFNVRWLLLVFESYKQV